MGRFGIALNAMKLVLEGGDYVLRRMVYAMVGEMMESPSKFDD